MGKLRFILPNTFTSLNFLLGVFSICWTTGAFDSFSAADPIRMGAYFVILSALFDKLDGFAARLFARPSVDARDEQLFADRPPMRREISAHGRPCFASRTSTSSSSGVHARPRREHAALPGVSSCRRETQADAVRPRAVAQDVQSMPASRMRRRTASSSGVQSLAALGMGRLLFVGIGLHGDADHAAPDRAVHDRAAVLHHAVVGPYASTG